MSFTVSALPDVSRSAPIPIPRRTRKRSGTAQTPDSPRSSVSVDSEFASSISRSSDVGSWVPEGKYVPIHRRTESSSSYTTTTPLTSAPSSPRSIKFTSHSDPTSESAATVVVVKQQSEPESSSTSSSLPSSSQTHVYSRETLLALAPPSLVLASVKPVVTPALIRSHPTIFRRQGGGIAHALEMARTPVNVHTSYALGRSPPKSSSKRAKSSSPPPSRHSPSEFQQEEMDHQQQEQQQQPSSPKARTRRRRRRRMGQGQMEGLGTNGTSSSMHTITTSANLIKENQRAIHYLDLVHSWRAPQAVQA